MPNDTLRSANRFRISLSCGNSILVSRGGMGLVSVRVERDHRMGGKVLSWVLERGI
jgi:hypothetical protein